MSCHGAGRNIPGGRSAGHDIFNLENSAKLAAEVGAIFVRHARQRDIPRRGLIQKYPKHARLATAEELDFHHFEPAGGGYPLRDFPHTINVKRHESNSLQAMAAPSEGPN